MNREKIKQQIAQARDDLMLAPKVVNNGVPNAEYLYACRNAADKLSRVWVNIESELLNKVADKNPALFVCMFTSCDMWNISRLVEKQKNFCADSCEKYTFSPWFGLEYKTSFKEFEESEEMYYFTIDNGRIIFFHDLYVLTCYFQKEIDSYLDGEYGEPNEKTIETLGAILNSKY